MKTSARRIMSAKLGFGRTKWASSAGSAMDATSTASPPISFAISAYTGSVATTRTGAAAGAEPGPPTAARMKASSVFSSVIAVSPSSVRFVLVGAHRERRLEDEQLPQLAIALVQEIELRP